MKPWNHPSLSRPHSPPHRQPCLRFSTPAWLKWQYLCHIGPTEVAGFGLSNENDPLLLDDILIIKQRASICTVAFDDSAVADLFDRMADWGIQLQRFARIWLHTHPGASVTPSTVDEQTFQRCFGSCDWAVMAILGRTGRTYARLRFNAGPGGSMVINTKVDWAGWPDLADDPSLHLHLADWEQEYRTLVEADVVRFREQFLPSQPFPDFDPFQPTLSGEVHGSNDNSNAPPAVRP